MNKLKKTFIISSIVTILLLISLPIIYISSFYLPLPFINTCYSVIEKDIFTYNVLKDCYSKDKNSAYYRDETIAGSHPTSFTVIANGYALDSYRVYFRGAKVPEADPSSFNCPKWDSTYLPFCDNTPSPYCTDFCSDENHKFREVKIVE